MGTKDNISGSAAMGSTRTGEMPITDILLKYQQGSSKAYDIFLSQLADPGIEPAVLVTHLKGLKRCVSLLGKDFEVLVGVILKLEWASVETTRVAEAYSSLLVNLLSAHTIYLKASLRMIVKQFYPKYIMSPDDKQVVDGINRKKDEKIFIHLHTLLSTIIKIIPLTPQVLLPLLADCFPYLGKDAYIQECYMRNLLSLSQYLPKSRTRLLELILDRMMKLDVRSPRQEIQQAEGDHDDDEDDDTAMDQDIMFVMDEVDKSLSCELQPKEKADNNVMSHQDAHKLDVMMDMMFHFIHQTCHHSSGELDWEATKKLYRELLYLFDRLILPTHDCCHVQFIMFYIISFREDMVEGFIDYLWKKVLHPNTYAVFRQAAVSYIASLLARGKFVPLSIVKVSMELLVDWIHQYIKQTAYTTSNADVDHHGPFYSVCQAVFYVFAFRHKELLNMPKGYEYIQNFNLQNVVTCRLNPLRICLPIVARTFANITRMHQLVFCDTILEKNKRSLLPIDNNRGASVPSNHLNPLDSFFPFDPYLLSKSGEYILPLYREYEGTPVEDSEDSEESDEDMEQLEQKYYEDEDRICNPEELILSTNQGKTPMTPTTDFLMYGVSPGFKHT